jgi:MFS family permease
VSGPLLGHASDWSGRKPMLIVSQIGTCIGFLVLARATSLWMIYLSRVIDGVTAGNLSLAQAYISDNTAPQNRARAFGLIGIAFGLGFFVGPPLTGVLSARFGLTAPIYLAAVMSATSILCTATLLKGGRPAAPAPGPRSNPLDWRTYAQYFSRPGLRPRLWQFFFFMLAFSTFISGFALFAERRFVWQDRPFGPREIGYLFGYVGLLGIILQGGLIGRLVARFGEPALVSMGFSTLIVGYFGLGLAHSVLMLLVFGTVSAFGNGVIRPGLSSLITQHAGRHEQGVVIGLTQSLMSLASILAPVIAGVLIQHNMLTLWAWIAAGMALVGAVLSRTGDQHRMSEATEDPAVLPT